MAKYGPTPRSWRHIWRCECGVSAIELAMIMPILAMGLLVMVDLGMAAGVRMQMDRHVRAGAQAAMSLNNSTSSIAEIVTVSSAEAADLGVSVNLVCSCAGTPADCSAPCGSGDAPSVFVDLVATRDYSGVVLSNLQLRAENRVQIR
jgi:pilus assembly protein CpaE